MDHLERFSYELLRHGRAAMAEPPDSILGVMVARPAVMASSSAARSRAPTWRSAVLSLLKACSMGKKSGE